MDGFNTKKKPEIFVADEKQFISTRAKKIFFFVMSENKKSVFKKK